MNVIRFDSEATATMDIRPCESKVIWKERQQAAEEGQALLAAARAEAEQIVAEARLTIRKAKAGARLEGLAEGRAELESAFAELLALRGRALKNMRADLIRLAMALSMRILRAEVQSRPEVVADMCRGVLNEYKAGKQIRILVHEADLPVLRKNRKRLSRDLGLDLRPEPSGRVARGGCILNGSHGTIDARLGVQLAFLAKTLLGARDHAD